MRGYTFAAAQRLTFLTGNLTSSGCELHQIYQLARRHHVAVDHVHDLELFHVKLVRSCSAAILDHDDAEALVRKAADGGRDALVSENAATNDRFDTEIGQS